MLENVIHEIPCLYTVIGPFIDYVMKIRGDGVSHCIIVVSTVVFGILFAHFSTVEYIPTVYSFLLTSLTVNERNESESLLFPPLNIDQSQQ